MGWRFHDPQANILSQRSKTMDFTAWSPSHTLLVLFAIVAFIGHVAIMFYRINHLEKQMDNTDKHISEMREEIRNEIRDLRLEIGKMNQNLSTTSSNTTHEVVNILKGPTIQMKIV